MGLFEHFPYVNFHELNQDWLIKQVKKNTAMIDAVYSEDKQDVVLFGRLRRVNGVWKCDVTAAQIEDFYILGKPVYLWVENGFGTYPSMSQQPIVRLQKNIGTGNYEAYTAPFVDTANSKVVQYKYTIAFDGTITETAIELSV